MEDGHLSGHLHNVRLLEQGQKDGSCQDAWEHGDGAWWGWACPNEAHVQAYRQLLLSAGTAIIRQYWQNCCTSKLHWEKLQAAFQAPASGVIVTYSTWSSRRLLA